MLRRPLLAAALLVSLTGNLQAQVNVGTVKADADQPFSLTTIDHFNFPWKIAFLPDQRLLVTDSRPPWPR